MTEPKAFEFHAEVRQVKSMVDHSYNVTLNFGEDQIALVQRLMEMVNDEVTGGLVFTQNKEKSDDVGQGRKR